MRKFLNLKKLFLILLILALGVLMYFEITRFAPSRLQASDYTVSNAAIPSDFDGVQIAVFSDVYGDQDKLNKALDLLNLKSPDVVVFLGNLFNETDETSVAQIETLLSKIHAPLGKYALLGSHDMLNYETVVTTLNNSDFRLTQNKSVAIHNFTDTHIQFLFLDENNTEQSMSEVVESLNDAIFTVTFMNNPNIVNALSTKNLSIAIGGETLGGKVNLPLIGSLFFKDTFTHSDVTIGKTRLLLSHGVSTPEPKLRLFADPNIVFITLNASE